MSLPALSSTLPLALDVMGAESAIIPAFIEGAVVAADKFGISSVLVGNESGIKDLLGNFRAERNPKIQIVHTSEVIGPDEGSSAAMRAKTNSSMRAAFEVVKAGKACALLSAGNAGAIMAAGLYVSGSLPGIARPAVASMVPRLGQTKPLVLLDSGANIDSNAHQLVQFGIMGSIFTASTLGIDRPRVALLSNGSESAKGSDVTRAAAQVLNQTPQINFVGYIEGQDLCKNIADVAVCDGFLGHVVLKTLEGAVEVVFESLKAHVDTGARGKIGMWLAKPKLKSLFAQKSEHESGGSPLLGLQDVVFACHQHVKTNEVVQAMRAAKDMVHAAAIAKMKNLLGSLDITFPGLSREAMWSSIGRMFQ